MPNKPEGVIPIQWSIQLYYVSLPGNQIILLTFKITDIAAKVKNKTEWYSDPFYTGTTGYRMHLRVDVGGDGNNEGTHCSIFLRLIRGRYDDAMSWPLKIYLQVTLLNQINNDHTTHA